MKSVAGNNFLFCLGSSADKLGCKSLIIEWFLMKQYFLYWLYSLLFFKHQFLHILYDYVLYLVSLLFWLCCIVNENTKWTNRLLWWLVFLWSYDLKYTTLFRFIRYIRCIVFEQYRYRIASTSLSFSLYQNDKGNCVIEHHYWANVKSRINKKLIIRIQNFKCLVLRNTVTIGKYIYIQKVLLWVVLV